MRSPTNQVLNTLGRDFLAMSCSRQRYWLGQARSYWRGQGFPYPKLSSTESLSEFASLCGIRSRLILQSDLIAHSTAGIRLANAFHPQMWHVRVHGRSPAEIFEDDEKLTRALQKAARFWPDRHCWNARCLRSVLRIMHRTAVSNFRPTVARALLQHYSGPGERVLDFSAGYGGRLLGALSVERHYTGIDPASAQVCGLRGMVKAVSRSFANTQLIQGCSEDILPSWPKCSFSVVLSSPPYFNCERYSNEPTQSYMRYPSYDEWKNKFLSVVLVESFRVLEKGGHLLLNVANTSRFAIASDAEQICLQHFGRPKRVLRMLMTKIPSARLRRPRSIYRWEPVYVFRKK
jgi:hypothetical protein